MPVGTYGQSAKWFFDSAAVKKRLAAGVRGPLSKAGAVVMRSARKSIKSAPTVSPPGTPPHAHDFYTVAPKNRLTKTGRLAKGRKKYRFKESVLFAFDPATNGVTVGFVKFETGRSGKPLPGLLEYGGRGPVVTRTGQREYGRYAPRPTLQPAVDRERAKIAPLFRNCMGG